MAPLLGDLRADTGLSPATAGLLTTLPVLCFGAFAPLAPRIARRVGLELAVAASLLVLGWLYDLTGGWTVPVLLLVACLVPMTRAGWGAARTEVLSTGERPRAASPV